MLALNPVERACVVDLADAILPIQTWLSGRATTPVAVWRTLGQASLSCSDFGFESFVEAALNGAFEADEASDVSRWNAATANPTGKFPSELGDYVQWRQGLFPEDSSQPKFGLSEFDGAEVILKSESRPFRTRQEAYELGIPALVATSAGIGYSEWLAYAQKMQDNTAWRAADYDGLSSRDFLRLFTKDLLACVFNMRSPEAREPRQSALLAELGERRRVGNMYGVDDVDRARAALAAVLKMNL